MTEETKKQTPWEKYKAKNPADRPAKIRDYLNPHLRVDEKIAEERFNICLGCPELIPGINVCKECGCPMKHKTKLANASCPIGKWQTVSITPQDEIKNDSA